MMILVGASASGKTQVAHILCEKYSYKKSVTTTTRPPRTHETNGVEYHFLTKSEFEALMEKDAFIEVTKYQDNYYGLQKKDICSHGITILDPIGVNNVLKQYQDAFVVYIKTSRQIREQRMIKRGDNKEQILLRLQSDDEVFDTKKIDQVNLEVENHHEPLEKLTQIIHESYQKYLNKTHKER